MNLNLNSNETELDKFARLHHLTISQSFLTNTGPYLRADLPQDKVYVETKIDNGLETIYLSYTEYNYSDEELLNIVKPIILGRLRQEKLKQLLDAERS
jgi:hypothetical protein